VTRACLLHVSQPKGIFPGDGPPLHATQGRHGRSAIPLAADKDECPASRPAVAVKEAPAGNQQDMNGGLSHSGQGRPSSARPLPHLQGYAGRE
jgi:hypothetical protein